MQVGRPESREAIQPERVDKQIGVFGTFMRLLWTSTLLWWVALGVFSDRIGLRRLRCALTFQSYTPYPWHVALRRTFERLGPAYIKFGQIIASSEGLFPRKLSLEFRKCLDQVPAFSFDQVRATLAGDLGKPVEQVFQSIEETPLAAASIAQVHGAVLADGREVVIKVQRPGLVKRVAGDVKVMHAWARLVERYSHRMRLANLSGIVDDFISTLSEEMDFRLEGLNMDEFNAILGSDPDNRVVAPHVHWEQTSPRVLTMERFVGWSVDDVERMQSMDDTEGELMVGVLAWLKTLLLGGMFHGDVHAGNLLYLEDGRIGFLDFGIVGRFTPEQRQQSMGFVLYLSTGDYQRFAELVARMSEKQGEVDLQELGRDLEQAYAPLTRTTMATMDYKEVMPAIQEASLKHGLKMPREFVLVTKQFLYFDRYARKLAPELNFFTDPRVAGQIMTMLPQLTGASTNASDGREPDERGAAGPDHGAAQLARG